MTRSDARPSVTGSMPLRRHVATGIAMAALALACGCMSARRDLPAPRLPDADALRAEAQATPTAPEPLYQLALLHYGKTEHEPALAALRASLDRDATYAPSLALLAKLLHEAGRSAEGVRFFEKRKIETLADPVRLNVALLYADVGNTMKARKLLQGVEAGPWADAAQVNLAYLDLVDEDNIAAVKRLQGGAGRYGDAAATRNNRALAELRAGDVEEGVQLLQDLAKAYPELATAQQNLALVLRHYLFDAGGAERAQAHFDALKQPAIGDAAWEQFVDPVHEDAAPVLPAAKPTAPAGAAPASAAPKPAPAGEKK